MVLYTGGTWHEFYQAKDKVSYMVDELHGSVGVSDFKG
jgi:hypothetical protein